MDRSPCAPRGGAAAAKILLVIACLALVACVGAACFDEDPTDPPPPPPPAPRAVTPDSLISLFAAALEDMDLEGYTALLDADYEFVPLPEDLAELGLEAGQTVDRAMELVIAGHIFGGVQGTNGAPGIVGIDIVTFDRMTEWVASTSAAYPGSVEALYWVELHFKHAEGYYRVTGQQKFWAVNRAEAGAEPLYTLLAQWDLTSGLKAQNGTWGGVKGMYR